MVKVLISSNIIKFLRKRNNIKIKFEKQITKLKSGANIGADNLYGVNNIMISEIKIAGVRFFFIKYHSLIYIETEDEFRDVIKFIDYAVKNKTGNQQDIIDIIKDKVKKYGMKI